MAQKMESTTPFQSGGNSSQHEKSGAKVPVKSKMSDVRNAGKPDPLVQVFISTPMDSRSIHRFSSSPTVAPRGASYNPAGAFGRPKGNLKSKATSMASHSSKPGENAVGKNSDRKGDNPLGKAMNRIGTKSGYPGFKPKGSGRRNA